jgi:hypothetical protein
MSRLSRMPVQSHRSSLKQTIRHNQRDAALRP